MPDALLGWTGLGRVLNQLKKYKEAVAAYEKAIELAPDQADLHLIAGVVYQEQLKQYQEALDHYNEYLRLGGADPVVQDWITECQKKLGK